MKRIIAANSNHCCIYDYHDQKKQLKLIKEIDHPENKLRDSELLTDRAGHYNNTRTNGGSFSPARDAVLINIDNFARQLAIELDKERNRHDYTELVLIMAPQMEGLVCHHLNKNIKPLIKHNIQKNLMHCTERELLRYINQYLAKQRKPLN